MEDRIDRYFRNDLSDQERADFEAQMAEDEQLRDMVDEMAASLELVRAFGKAELRSAFAEIDAGEERLETLPKQNDARQQTIVTLVKWAAAAAAIFAAGFWFLSKPTTEPQHLAILFEEYFSPFPNISDPVVRDDQGTTNELLRAYDQRDYLTFIQGASKIEHPTDTMLAYLVSARLATGQIRSTEVELNKLDEVDNDRFQQAGDWYRLMLALKRNDVDAARDQASLIVSNKGHLYRDRTLPIATVLD